MFGCFSRVYRFSVSDKGSVEQFWYMINPNVRFHILTVYFRSVLFKIKVTFLHYTERLLTHHRRRLEQTLRLGKGRRVPRSTSLIARQWGITACQRGISGTMKNGRKLPNLYGIREVMIKRLTETYNLHIYSRIGNQFTIIGMRYFTELDHDKCQEITNSVQVLHYLNETSDRFCPHFAIIFKFY